MKLQAHLVHKARVAEFVKGLASAQAKADEVLSMDTPKFVSSEFTEGARFLAIYQLNTMESFGQIYARDDFKAIVFGLYDAYDTQINDEGAKKLMKEVEIEAKLTCMRYKVNSTKEAAKMELRKSTVVLPVQEIRNSVKSINK